MIKLLAFVAWTVGAFGTGLILGFDRGWKLCFERTPVKTTRRRA